MHTIKWQKSNRKEIFLIKTTNKKIVINTKHNEKQVNYNQVYRTWLKCSAATGRTEREDANYIFAIKLNVLISAGDDVIVIVPVGATAADMNWKKLVIAIRFSTFPSSFFICFLFFILVRFQRTCTHTCLLSIKYTWKAKGIFRRAQLNHFIYWLYSSFLIHFILYLRFVFLLHLLLLESA